MRRTFFLEGEFHYKKKFHCGKRVLLKEKQTIPRFFWIFWILALEKPKKNLGNFCFFLFYLTQ